MTPPSDYKWLTRRRILKAALAQFLQFGYHGVGLDGIMKAAGLTKGAFYVHFESKEDLFFCALKEECLLEKLLEDIPAEEGLAPVLEAYFSPRHFEVLDEGCSFALLSLDAARGPHLFREEFGKKREKIRKQIASRVSDGMAGDVLNRILGAVVLAYGMEADERGRFLKKTKDHLLSEN